MRWYRIYDMIMKYATPGANVNIHILGNPILCSSPVANIKKVEETEF